MTPEKIALIKSLFDGEFSRSEAQSYPEGLPPLPSLPAARYHDLRYYQLEMQHLWTKSWVIAGLADELPDIGSYKLRDFINMPVVLLRGKDRKVRAFFNSCRHRGASLVREGAGLKKVLSCPFHGWTYDLEGRLKHVADDYDFIDLDWSQRNLIPLRCEQWGNLIFINREMNAPTLHDHLGPAVKELEHFDFEQRKLTTVIPFDLRCNWKVIVDAFQESYHLDATHPQSVAPILDNHGSVIEMWPNGHSILTVPRRREASGKQDFILDTGSKSQDPRHEITRSGNVSFTVFPNLIGTCAEFQFPILAFWPTSVNTTHIEIFITEPESAPDMDAAQAQNIVEQFSAVMLEDMSNVESIQRSVESGAITNMPLCAQERRIVQFHQELDRVIGVDRIPAELRIAPVLQR